MPSAFKKPKIYNNIIVSDEIDYYFGLLGQFNHNSTRHRIPTMATRVEGQGSRFCSFMYL